MTTFSNNRETFSQSLTNQTSALDFTCQLCVRQSTHLNLKTNAALCDNHSTTLYQSHDVKEPEDMDMVMTAAELADSKKVEAVMLKYCPQHDMPLTQQCSYCQVKWGIS